MKILFEEFMAINGLNLEELPDSVKKAIEKKIRVHNKLKAESQEVTGKDQSLLEKKRKELDEEIWDDLTEAFEDSLDNNDFYVSDEDYDRSIKNAYQVLEKFIPNLTNQLVQPIPYASMVIGKSKLSWEKISITKDEHRIVLSQNLDNLHIGVKPDIEFEVIINTEKKTAIAVVRLIKQFYQSIYGKDGFEHWPDQDLTYFYYVMTLSLIDWINDLIAEKVILNLAAADRSKPSNEEILESLYHRHLRDNLTKTMLKEHGLQVNFKDWEIHVGDYVLHRKRVFSYHFKLSKK